jgi:predicted ATPase
MRTDATRWGREMTLVGRRAERDTLDQFVEAMRAGESRALVVSGEAGVGKTALLEYLAEQAAECCVP